MFYDLRPLLFPLRAGFIGDTLTESVTEAPDGNLFSASSPAATAALRQGAGGPDGRSQEKLHNLQAGPVRDPP